MRIITINWYSIIGVLHPSREEFLVTSAFAQGLLLGPMSIKMQGTMPKSRDELKYMVEKYLLQIEVEERKQANSKDVVNTYLKQESVDSYSRHNHKESNYGNHKKQSKDSRHSSRRFCPFVKDNSRRQRSKVCAIENTRQRAEKEKANTANTTRAKHTTPVNERYSKEK